VYSYFDTICFVFEYPTLSIHNFIIRSIGKFFSKLLLINKSNNLHTSISSFSNKAMINDDIPFPISYLFSSNFSFSIIPILLIFSYISSIFI